MDADAGTVNFDLTSTPTSSGGTNDTINVANLVLNGLATIDVNLVGHGLSNGAYNLFSFSGAPSGGAGNLQLAGISSSGVRQSFSLMTSAVQRGRPIAGLGKRRQPHLDRRRWKLVGRGNDAELEQCRRRRTCSTTTTR